MKHVAVKMGVSDNTNKSNKFSMKLMKKKNKENIVRKPLPKFTKNVSNEKSTFLKRSKMVKEDDVESMKIIWKKKEKVKISNKCDDTKDLVKVKKKNKKDESVINFKKSKEIESNEDLIVNDVSMESRTNPSTDESTVTKKVVKKRKQVELEENNDEEEDSLKKLSRKHILQCISAIFHLNEEQLDEKNALFSNEAQPIFMQITCIRVPKVPRRQMRMLLPHSVVSTDDDVALFVCDLERGRRKDYEKTVDYYKELLEKCGCTRIKDIIPMNQVKTEYDQFELKRKLVSSYDYFLVDGRIAGHMCHLLGSTFVKRRKLPTSIRMNSDDLKHEIDKALRKTSMSIHSLSDTHIVQVGHTAMKKKHILENVITVCKFLSENYPGGFSNIRALRLKTPLGPGLPIYITLKNKNYVEVPEIKPKRPKAYCDVEGELTTASGKTKVTVTPEGDVMVTRIKARSKRKREEQD